MSCILSRVEVPQIQRQGLIKAEIVDWDLKPHLNMCSFLYSGIYMNLKPFLHFCIFGFICVLFCYNKLNFCLRML